MADGDDWPIRPREKYTNLLRLAKGTPFIKVITGIRRCGKSTLMKQFIQELMDSGIPAERVLYLNLESDDPELPRDGPSLSKYVSSKIPTERGSYLFIDEVQTVQGWEIPVASLYGKGVDIYITGSNSQMLSTDLSTRLSGRYIEVRVRPLSFSEYVSFREDSGLSPHELFDTYLVHGGMPAIAVAEGLSARPLIPAVLEGIYRTVYSKDIFGRHSIRNPAVMENFILYLMRNIGNRTSPKNIAGFLTSKGQKVTAATISEYMVAIDDALLMSRSERVSSATGGYMETTDKFYATDLGIRNHVAPMKDGELSALLENAVYNELLYRFGSAATLDVDGKEVDFVVSSDGELSYYQVAVSIIDDVTRERELKPLRALKDNYPKTIVTYDRYPIKDIGGIRVVQVVDWLLEGV